MGRIRTTIELAKTSWDVLRQDKELLMLPVISAITAGLVAASFFLPAGLLGNGTAQVLLFILGYLALSFVTIFFNAALVSAAHERLAGGDPTIGSAIRGAAEHIGAIFAWSVVAATVSAVIRAIQDRGGLLGRLVGSIAGVAWSLVTFLVIPIIVLERQNVGSAVSRSAELFKRTWGENVAANVGFGLLGFVAVLPAVALVVLGAASNVGALIVASVVVAVVWMIAVAVVISALSAVFQTVLYHYAAGVGATGPFTQTELSAAFRLR